MPILTLNPIKDSYITPLAAGTNFGTQTTLELGYYQTSTSSYHTGYVYIQFDLSSIPATAIINSAYLRIFQTGSSGAGSIKAVYVRVVNASWEENTIKYSESPSEIANEGYGITYALSSATVNAWHQFDALAIVDKWIKGTYANNGFELFDSVTDVFSALFASKEHSDSSIRPQLVIDYTLTNPSTPTNLSPSGGLSVDRAAIQRISWKHNPYVSGEAQYKFDFQWRLQGNSTWNTVSQNTANQYYDAPANTFPHGYIEWQVRTYGQDGQASAWSDIAVFYAADVPPAPVITSPQNNSVLTGPRLTITWTSTGQVDYNLKILDSTGAIVLYEKTIKSIDTSLTPDYTLENGKSFKIQVRVKNSDETWSNYSTVDISTNYVNPAVPTFIITTDNARGSIKLIVTNPNPTVGQPSILQNEIFRRKQGETSWMRIAIILNNGEYVDYTPQHMTSYEYKVRAVGENYSYIDTDLKVSSVTIKNTTLALINDPTVWVKLKLSSKKTQTAGRRGTLTHFVGRENPVTEWLEQKDNIIDASFIILDVNIKNTFEEIVNSGDTLIFRDSRGRRMFCSIPEPPIITDEFPNYYTVSFTAYAVDYKEGV